MKLRRVLVGLLALATLGFFAQQLRTGVATISSTALPGPGRIVASVALLLTGQVLIGEALSPLLRAVHPPRNARTAFHATHVAKYIPAGLAQGVGLVLALERLGVRRSEATIGWVLHTAIVIVAGIGTGLALSVAGGWSPVFLVPAALSLALIWRSMLQRALTILATRVARIGRVGPLPTQGQLLRAWATNAAGLMLHALAFAILAHDLRIGVASAAGAYLLSQALATMTPLPGGLGAREALLTLFTSGSDPDILTSVVLVRVLLMIVEALLTAVGLARMGRGADRRQSRP